MNLVSCGLLIEVTDLGSGSSSSYNVCRSTNFQYLLTGSCNHPFTHCIDINIKNEKENEDIPEIDDNDCQEK